MPSLEPIRLAPAAADNVHDIWLLGSNWKTGSPDRASTSGDPARCPRLSSLNKSAKGSGMSSGRTPP